MVAFNLFDFSKCSTLRGKEGMPKTYASQNIAYLNLQPSIPKYRHKKG